LDLKRPQPAHISLSSRLAGGWSPRFQAVARQSGIRGGLWLCLTASCCGVGFFRAAGYLKVRAGIRGWELYLVRAWNDSRY